MCTLGLYVNLKERHIDAADRQVSAHRQAANLSIKIRKWWRGSAGEIRNRLLPSMLADANPWRTYRLKAETNVPRG